MTFLSNNLTVAPWLHVMAVVLMCIFFHSNVFLSSISKFSLIRFAFQLMECWLHRPLNLFHIDGLGQERCNSSELAMELPFSCTNPSICTWWAQNSNLVKIIYVNVKHYSDVIMTTIASQITSLTIVYSIVYSDTDQRKHQSSASLAFVWGIHRDRWIPRTKDQLHVKCFHLMTSSWEQALLFQDLDDKLMNIVCNGLRQYWTNAISIELWKINGQRSPSCWQKTASADKMTAKRTVNNMQENNRLQHVWVHLKTHILNILWSECKGQHFANIFKCILM